MVFPLCWLFNYTRVREACVYGTLTEREPVQLKCLQANAQSHKAAPSGPSFFHQTLNDCRVPALKGRPSCQPLAHCRKYQWREGSLCETCHQAQLEEGARGNVAGKTPSWLQMPSLEISRLYHFEPMWCLETYFHGHPTQLPRWALGMLSASWGCSLRDPGKLRGWNASRIHGGTTLGHTDSQASAIKHVTPVLATGAGVLGQLSLWLSIADSWQFNFTPQVPHYLCRHLENMWSLDRISDQWQRLHRVQVVAVKVKVSVHELAVVGIHDSGV